MSLVHWEQFVGADPRSIGQSLQDAVAGASLRKAALLASANALATPVSIC